LCELADSENERSDHEGGSCDKTSSSFSDIVAHLVGTYTRGNRLGTSLGVENLVATIEFDGITDLEVVIRVV